MAKSKASANDIFSSMAQAAHVETKTEKSVKEIKEGRKDGLETAEETAEKEAVNEASADEEYAETGRNAEFGAQDSGKRTRGRRKKAQSSQDPAGSSSHKKEKSSNFRTIVAIPMELMDDVDIASEAYGSRQAYIIAVLKRDLEENIDKYKMINEMKAEL